MKRLLKKLPYLCVLLAPMLSLSASKGFKLPSLKEGKNLYEMIGLDQADYNRRRDTALQGIDTMPYAAIKKELQAIPQAKDLSEKLYKAIKEKITYDAGSDPLERPKDKTYEQVMSEYRYLLSKARELIKQARYKGTFDTWAKEEITRKCKQARQNVRKDIEKIEQEMKNYPADESSRLQKDLSKAKEKLKHLAEGCIFLMNPKFRAQYDGELEEVSPPSAAYENVRDAVESSMRLAGTGTRIKLNAIIGDFLSRVELPGAATKLFNQDLELTDVRVLPKPQGEDIKYYIGFTGTTVFNTFALAINVYFIWNIFNQVRFSVGVATPDNYRLTNMFPSLRALNWMIFPKGKLVAANFNGTDVDGYSFEKGLNFLAEWDIFSGPLAFFKKLQTAAPKLEGLVFEADPIRLEGVIPKNPMSSTLKAKVPMYIGLDFTKMSKLPNAFTRVINKITLGGLKLEISPSAPTLGVRESRLDQLRTKRDAAKAKLESAQRRARESGDFFVDGGDLHRAYESAEKAYQAEEKRVKPLRKAQAKVEKEKLASVAQEEEVVGVQALFEEEGVKQVQEAHKEQAERPEPIASKTRFKKAAEKAEGRITTVTSEQSERARGLAGKVPIAGTISKFGFTVQAKAEGILQLGTQPDPIKLVVSGFVIPPGLKHPQGFISLAARLKNMLDFGWLAIGNAGIVLDIDVAAVEALIAFGIPVSGIFINGQIDLGKPGESRASLKAGAGISVTSQQPIDALIFDVSGENIRPTDFVRFIGYQLMKSQHVRKGVQGLSAKASQLYSRVFPKSGGIPSLSLPELIFHKVWGYAALGSATIGKQTYKSGLGLQVEIELMKKKAGLKIEIGDQEKGYSFEGFGYGPPLSLTIKGRNLIKLYSAQDPAKGPYITWNFNPKELFGITPSASRVETLKARVGAAKEDIIKGGSMSLDGVLELPMLGLKQKAKFSWANYSIDADFESEVAGYTILFGIKMNTRGDEIDEGAFAGNIASVRNALAQKDPQSANAVAAMFLLRAAEDKQTKLGEQLLVQTQSVLKTAPPKPRSKSKSWTQQAKDLYAGGLSGIKDLIFTMPEEIPHDVKVQAADIFRRESMKAELKALNQEVDDVNKTVSKDEKITIPAPLKQAVARALVPNMPLKEGKSALSKYRAAVNAKLADVRPTIGLQDWKGFLVKFGFKNVGELSKQLSEQLVPYLDRLKESYTKRIEAIDAKAKRWETGDIDPTKEREAIGRRETKIAQMKALCGKRPYRSQIVCQSKIKLEQTKLLKDKAILKAFIESKVSKNVKRVAAIGYRKAQTGRALKAVGQKTLGALSATAQAIAKGIDILNIKEILGQYSYQDMKAFKLPRLVRLIAEVNIMDMKIPIALNNLQFDFKQPMRSIRAISHAIFDVMHKAMQQEFLSDMPQDMQDLINESIGL